MRTGIVIGILLGIAFSICVLAIDCRDLNRDRFCKRIELPGRYEVFIADLTRKQ